MRELHSRCIIREVYLESYRGKRRAWELRRENSKGNSFVGKKRGRERLGLALSIILEVELVGLAAELDMQCIGEGEIKDGSLLRENYGGNYLMFSCKYTRFGKSVNHPGEDVKKLHIQVRGKGHRNNKCR